MVIIGLRYSKSTFGANESKLATTTKKIFTTNTVTTTMTKLMTMMIEDNHNKGKQPVVIPHTITW